ncbi:MAG TPA: carboxymuconolactone decarboxylase family protein [Pseudolysinimonas sp.]|nr:carboxymuconolactone decarboxylase family protein [Pseudolysinimonas sp.]
MNTESHPANTEPRPLFDAGDAVRRRVLGDEHVDRSWRNATDFTRPLVDLVTEYCWGAIWTRPGLELKTRSLINIGMLAALGKGEELELHVKGAVRNGCTDDEIQEVLLQAAIYCGVPAALEATRHARSALDSIDRG